MIYTTWHSKNYNFVYGNALFNIWLWEAFFKNSEYSFLCTDKHRVLSSISLDSPGTMYLTSSNIYLRNVCLQPMISTQVLLNSWDGFQIIKWMGEILQILVVLVNILFFIYLHDRWCIYHTICGISLVLYYILNTNADRPLFWQFLKEHSQLKLHYKQKFLKPNCKNDNLNIYFLCYWVNLEKKDELNKKTIKEPFFVLHSQLIFQISRSEKPGFLLFQARAA